jgi:hypothetical protein
MAKEQDSFDSAIEAEEAEKPTTVSETAELLEGEQATEQPKEQEQAAQQPPEGEKTPEAAQGAAQPTDQQPTPQPHVVPLSELLSTRERAQTAERERDELRRALETIQRHQQAAQARPAEPPDMFADPQAFTQHLQHTFQEGMRQVALDFDLRLAETKHGETFQKAWEAFLGAVGTGQNPQLYHQVMTARSPGEEIVSWFRRDQVLREVGNDPAAYRQKLADELLNDQGFVAKAIERVRAQANGGQPQGQSSQNVTRLPSLSRQTAAAPARTADDGDDSDDAVWEATRDARGRFAARE